MVEFLIDLESDWKRSRFLLLRVWEHAPKLVHLLLDRVGEYITSEDIENEVNNRGENLLMSAARNGDLNLMKTILEKYKVNPYMLNKHGENIL